MLLRLAFWVAMFALCGVCVWLGMYLERINPKQPRSYKQPGYGKYGEGSRKAVQRDVAQRRRQARKYEHTDTPKPRRR